MEPTQLAPLVYHHFRINCAYPKGRITYKVGYELSNSSIPCTAPTYRKIPYDETYEQLFFNKKFSFETSKVNLFFHALQYPLVKKALSYLISDYDHLAHLSASKVETGINLIEERLSLHHKNLDHLIAIINDSKEHHLALMQISPISNSSDQINQDYIRRKRSTSMEALDQQVKQEQKKGDSLVLANSHQQLLVTPYFGENAVEINQTDYKEILNDHLKKITLDEDLKLGIQLDQELQKSREKTFSVRSGPREGTIESFKDNIRVAPPFPTEEEKQQLTWKIFFDHVPPSMRFEIDALKTLTRKIDIDTVFSTDALKKISENFKTRRENSPITTRQIQQLGDLYNRIIDVKLMKTWVEVVQSPSDDERNLIYTQNEDTSNKTYLKEGKTGPTDYLEVLAFQTACLFKLESSFAATTFATIKQNTGENPFIKGSIQTAITGRDLSSRFKQPLDTDPIISKQELIHASLVTFLFGMFDLNETNIFITPKGKFIFFDNSRSLPHGDLLIFHQNIIPAYRSSLLALPGSFEVLTLEEKQSIIQTIDAWEKEIPHFETFLKRKTFLQKGKEKQLFETLSSHLPPFWLNQDLVIKEMKARLERVKNTVSNGKEISLQDLSFASCPSFKLLLLLHIAAFAPLDTLKATPQTLRQIQLDQLRGVGSKDFRALIMKCDQDKIDVDALYKNKDKPMETLLTELIEGKFKKTTETKPSLLKTLIQQAEVELKDTNLKISIDTIKQHEDMVRFIDYLLIRYDFNLFDYEFDYKNKFLNMKKEEEKEKTKKETDNRNEAAKQFFQNSSLTYLILSPVNPQLDPLFTLIYRDGQETKEVILDFFVKPSEVCLDQHALPSLDLTEFKEYCKTLPTSLRAVKKETLTNIVESYSIPYNGQRINVLILD